MKKEHVKLSEEHRRELKDLLKQGQAEVKLYRRALALVELDQGKTYTEVARMVKVTIQTVSTWASKYREKGLEFLTDQARSGRPPSIDGLQRAAITALACSEPPVGYARWSLRLLADKAVELEMVESISHSEVGKILKKTTSNRTVSDTGVLEN